MKNRITSATHDVHARKPFLKILLGLGGLLTILIAILAVIPVILLPLSTAVPLWITIALVALDLAIAFVALRKLNRPVVRGLVLSSGFILIAVVAVMLSQVMAYTPPILDESGNPVAGSIAVLEQVTLNDSKQWVSIRGQDASKPVLLFLAGGPGGSQLATARFALEALEKDFVVVNWEQPGAGKSFDAVNRSTLTPERYINDAHALTLLLQERFGQEKIYILGESWGSALGIMLVQRYPDAYHAFMGTGQMVAFLENDLVCYDFAMQLAEEHNDSAKIEKLLEQGPPPYYGKGVAMKQAAYLMDGFNYMNSNPNITNNGFNTFRDLAAPEYGLYDKINWFRGVLDTLGFVYPHLWDVDFREQATFLDVPVYFLIGRHDINAPTSFVEEYYDLLDAPHKEIIWFEHSGHNPWVSESELFVQTIVETVLNASPVE